MFYRMLTRPEIKERAKKRLSEQRGNAILNWFLPGLIISGALFLVSLLAGGGSLLGYLPEIFSGSEEEAAMALLDMVTSMLGSSILVSLGTFVISFIANPLITCGQSRNALRLYRGQKMEVSDLFHAFKKEYFGHTLGGMLWMNLFLVLWSLIPVAGPILAVIKGYAYSMTPYILLERPEIDARTALKKSIQMTEGHKGKLFVLDLSFIGWWILNSLTLGILGILMVAPYAGITHAGFYDELERLFFGERMILDGVDMLTGRDERWKCPFCGGQNRGDSVYCVRCGKPKSAADDDGTIGEVPPETEDVWEEDDTGDVDRGGDDWDKVEKTPKRDDTDIGGSGRLVIRMSERAEDKPHHTDTSFHAPKDI